jgi:tetratricopeptide (TPR) repeat protein
VRIAIRIEPRSARLYTNLGIFYSNPNNIKRILSHRNSYPSQLSSNPEYRNIVDAFKEAIRLDANYDRAWSSLAEFYASVGQHKEAIDLLLWAINTASDQSLASALYIHLEIAYREAGLMQEGIKVFRVLVSRHPSDPSAKYALGCLYTSIGDKASALEQYKILKGLNKEWAESLFRIIYSKE